jgi:hypothetical protein
VNVSLRAKSDNPHAFDDVIGQLHRTRGGGVDAVVAGFPAEQRARLALFCFSRAHMREIGIAIAATCELDVLSDIGAAAGAALYTISRERPVIDKVPTHGRPKITLASPKPCAPFEDAEPDADIEAGEAEADHYVFAPEPEPETVAA